MSDYAMSAHRKARKSLWLTLLLVLLYLDLMLTGSGFWSTAFLGFSFRRLAFVVIWCFSFYHAFTNLGKYKNLIYLLLGFVLLLMFYQPVVLMLLHGSWLYFADEVVPILFLVSTPLIAASLVDVTHCRLLMVFISLFGVVSAIIHLILLFLLRVQNKIVLYPIINFIHNFLRNPLNDASDNIVLGFFTWSEFRVFWASSMMMFCGVLSSCFLLHHRDQKKLIPSILNLGNFIICVLGIMATGVRSFQLAIVLMCSILSLRYVLRLSRLKIRISAFTKVVIFCQVILLMHLSLEPSFLSVLGIDRPESDSIRFSQFQLMFDSFSDNPFFGVGLGSTFANVRSPSTPWTYELAILSIATKVGLVGCALFLIYLFAIVRCIFSGSKGYFGLWFIMLLSMLPVFSTNPFLFSSMGVGLLLICFVEGFYSHELK